MTGLGLGVLSAIVTAAGLKWGFPEQGFGATFATLTGIVAGILMGGVVVVLRSTALRRGIVSIVPGRDAATRRAVRRALRVGHADDPHIDALTRDFAARSPRGRWLPYLYLALCFMCAVRLIGEAQHSRNIAAPGAVAVAWLLCALVTWRQRRRLTGYGRR